MTVILLLSQCFVLAAAPAPETVAFLTGPVPEQLRVSVLDVAAGAVAPVGPGRADGAPVWSPDGAWLAFDVAPEGAGGEERVVWLVQADGSGGHALPHAGPLNRSPRWSPDSARLAYESGPFGETQVMVYQQDTDTEMPWGGGRKGLMRPVWVDAGTVLAVALKPGDNGLTTELVLVTQDATTPVPKEAMPSQGDYVEWWAEPNPGSFGLAYESNDGGDREIYVASLKYLPMNVTNHRAPDWGPRWAPKGKMLAFESLRGGRCGVYRVDPETVLVQTVAAGPDHDDWAPAWSADGQWLAFVSNRTGNPELYRVRVRGSEPEPLTANGQLNYAPAWRPRGKR